MEKHRLGFPMPSEYRIQGGFERAVTEMKTKIIQIVNKKTAPEDPVL